MRILNHFYILKTPLMTKLFSISVTKASYTYRTRLEQYRVVQAPHLAYSVIQCNMKFV